MIRASERRGNGVRVEHAAGCGRVAVVLLVAAWLGLGCAGGGAASVGSWGGAVPRDDRDLALAGLPAEAQRAFLPLSQVFYERITSRRFNSRATFDDPSVRQFFPSVAAYSDYYAALVDVLDRAHFRFNQPTRIELLGLAATGDGVLTLSLRFVGLNDLPLRWWSTSVLRKDEWRWLDGRWWVVPGKL
ncbi:hypothetical protein K2X89_01200 [Myxococcota bacterium]|nr:hypothetical protein [Myxococcota bacterium]